MNPGLPSDHASIHFYDSDYPSTHASPVAENCDAILDFQGLAHDLDRFLELAAEGDGPVLDLCCGTGRVSIALARAGHDCYAVDINPGMLAVLRENLARQPQAVAERVRCFEQDVTALDLPRRDFRLAICAFNSLLCIPSFDGQRRALAAFADHLAPGGCLALDLVNPLQLDLRGDPVPKPFFTRRHPVSGRTYTRFAASDPIDAEQRQRLHGWYDELGEDGTVRRTAYSLVWRPIFRYELELLLELSGLALVSLEGGHRHEPFEARSRKLFALAKRADSTASGARGDRFVRAGGLL